MKILVIRFSSIGDIAQTSPVVRCLRNTYPDAAIHFLTKKEYAPIVQHNPNIDKHIFLAETLSQTIKQLKQEHYDVVIDLHHNLRTFLIKLSLRAKSYSFPKLNIEKWLLTTFGINLLPKNLHLVDRYFETCSKLDVKNDGLGLDYFVASCDQINTETQLPIGFSQNYIAWVIGAKHFTKILPSQKVIAAIERLVAVNPNVRVVLIGGKEDAERGDLIAQNFSDNVFNGCGKFSLNQSVSIVAQAAIVVGNDTGLTQIAPAFKKPVISIWGSTSTVFGVEPYFASSENKSTVIEVNTLACRPCTKFGRSKCPKGHFKCMNDLNVDDIVNAISKAVKN